MKEGIREPSFQVNDYREIVWLYGLENKRTPEQCAKIIERFEGFMSTAEPVKEWTHTTNELWKQYEAAKVKSSEDFYVWMTDHADFFKGYSRTVQDYLIKLRRSILAEVRNELRERLEILLGETDYDRWKKKYSQKDKDEKELLSIFLRQAGKRKNMIAPHLLKTIRELYHLTYRDWDANSQLLSELYNNHGSAKHLSDLFNIPLMKEKEMQVRFHLYALEQMGEDEACPEEIRQFGTDLLRQEKCFDTAGNAKKVFEDYLKEQKRRNLLVQREDLLPMVLQLSQVRYRKEHPEGYDQKAAREFFIDMADKVMNACNMAPLNHEYQKDQLMLSCFREKEMISYAELLDELKQEC